jgi:hypothetical protein
MTVDDEPEERMLALSTAAMAALQEFYSDQANLDAKFSALKEASETRFDSIQMDLFQEDWQLSQFWVFFIYHN